MAALGSLGIQPVVVLRDDLLGQVPNVPVKILALQPPMQHLPHCISQVGQTA